MEPAILEALPSSTVRNTATSAKSLPTGQMVGPLKGQALLDALAGYIGSFEGPGDLSERHSEYFTAKAKRTAPVTGKALIKLWEGYIGSFEGPGDLSECHSEYFTEALSEKFERRKTQIQ